MHRTIVSQTQDGKILFQENPDRAKIQSTARKEASTFSNIWSVSEQSAKLSTHIAQPSEKKKLVERLSKLLLNKYEDPLSLFTNYIFHHHLFLHGNSCVHSIENFRVRALNNIE